MKYLIILLPLFFLVSCGKKKNQGCTQQNTSSNRLIISCASQRHEKPNSCNRTTVSSQNASRNEVCEMGFDINCAPAKIVPSAFKANVDNGTVVLINKQNGRQLKLKEVTAGSDVFLILQHTGDVGDSSSVDLPICSD